MEDFVSVYNRVDMPILMIDITGNYMKEDKVSSNLGNVMQEYYGEEECVNIRGRSCLQCCRRYSIFPQFICKIPDGAFPSSVYTELTNLGTKPYAIMVFYDVTS